MQLAWEPGAGCEQGHLAVPSSSGNLPVNQSSHDLYQMLILLPFNHTGEFAARIADMTAS
jgi:hypothetical protein